MTLRRLLPTQADDAINDKWKSSNALFPSSFSPPFSRYITVQNKFLLLLILHHFRIRPVINQSTRSLCKPYNEVDTRYGQNATYDNDRKYKRLLQRMRTIFIQSRFFYSYLFISLCVFIWLLFFTLIKNNYKNIIEIFR